MKTILRRLEHLERRQELIAPVGYDARAIMMEKIEAIAERMQAGGNWPPEPPPTIDEVKQRLAAATARYA